MNRIKEPIGALIQNLGHQFRDAIRVECKKKGINSTYSLIIMLLTKKLDGLSQNEIVEILCLKKPTISLTLKTMEQLGYISRVNSIDDSRKQIVTITELGKEIDVKIRECFVAVEKRMIKDISENDIVLFEELIIKMRNNLLVEEDING